MQERPDNFKHSGDDPEQTLVAPRFDAEEARRAHPVVPLAETRDPYAARSRSYARRGPLSPALMAVALLAVFVAGGVVATKVLRRTQPTNEAAQTPSAITSAQAAETPTQAPDEPARAAEAPASAVEPPPPVEAPREVDAEVPRAVADTKPEAPASRVRRTEEVGRATREEAARADDEDFKDDDRGRRGRDRGKRRKHAEDEGEQEMREVLKDARKKMPRLVDVLVRPRQ